MGDYWTNIRDQSISDCNAGFPGSTYPVDSLSQSQCYAYGTCVEESWRTVTGGVQLPTTQCYYDPAVGYTVCNDNAQYTAVKQSCYGPASQFQYTPPEPPPEPPPEEPPCDYSQCPTNSRTCCLL